MTSGSGRAFGAIATIAGIVAVVLATTAATEGGDPLGEQAVELVAFSQPVMPRHDRVGELFLDSLRELDDGQVQLVGWAAQTDRVEILADGEVVGTAPITQERSDVALANGFPNGFVGFTATVRLPRDDALVCVTRPGQLPGPDACHVPTLDLERHRVVAFYGVPDAPALGTLGASSAADARKRLVDQAKPYNTPERPVVHAFEVIATVAQASAGPDGNYSEPISHDRIWQYLREIRKVGGVVVIDLQTGRDSYMDQLVAFEDLLREPDVHLALDPEWHMAPGEIPNKVVGQSDASEVNEVMDYVADIVVQNRLPQKLVVVHNFQPRMITNRDQLDAPPEVELLIHMDGHGPPATKTGNYQRLIKLQDHRTGFKLFYSRDTPLMSPADVFEMDPDVDFVSYQ